MSFQIKTKLVLGLTGSMLSGKSTALMYFAKCGADIISCDDVVRELYTCSAVLAKIKAVLGTADKAQIAAQVFKNESKRKALEQILYPLILKAVQARLRKCKQKLIVVEAPLLFEAGWDKRMDLNIAVLADPKTLPARLKGRHLSRAEYMRRTRYQLKDEEKAARADVVFFHTTKAQLKQSVTRFCSAMNLLHVK